MTSNLHGFRPEVIDAFERWGGSTGQEEAFEAGWEAAIRTITAALYADGAASGAEALAKAIRDIYGYGVDIEPTLVDTVAKHIEGITGGSVHPIWPRRGTQH